MHRPRDLSERGHEFGAARAGHHRGPGSRDPGSIGKRRGDKEKGRQGDRDANPLPFMVGLPVSLSPYLLVCVCSGLRQRTLQNSSRVRRTVDFDRSVMILDNFFCDVKAQPRSALALLGRKIRIEDFVHLRRINSGTGILDSNVHIEILPRALHRNRSSFVDRRLHGINEHILNGAIYLSRIAQ